MNKIKIYVDKFIEYAKEHPEDNFLLTAIGTGLAGYKHSDIAPMFSGVPKNVKIPEEWKSFILPKEINDFIDESIDKMNYNDLRNK